MKPAILTLILVLTVGNLAHCQDWENLLFIKMEVVLEKQEAALSQLKEIQKKQGHIEDKLEHVENNLQEMQEKQEHIEGRLEHIENNLQELHNEMEHLKGQQELESSLHQEISGVISLLETGGIDECSEGSHNCGDYEVCTDKFVSFTCRCLPGFARNGSHCEDIDECTHGKAECSPQATCKNSIGSYSCSCNPPYEGDGQTCEFSCKSPAKAIEGLGCVDNVKEGKTWQKMKATCREAGGRLLQGVPFGRLQDVSQSFGGWGWSWIGAYEGKWLESGIPLEEELWVNGHLTDPSKRCGAIGWDPSSDLWKVMQYDCSEKAWGFCQFIV